MKRSARAIAPLAAAAVALATAAVAVAATVTVSPSHMAGWSVNHDSCNSSASTGSIAFVHGPANPPMGAGSVQYTIGSNGDSYETLRTSHYNGVKLSDLSALDYWTYESHFGPGGPA